MTQRLTTAIQAARAAGAVLAKKLDAPREIHSKGVRDIVTDADFAADHIIRRTLLGKFPRDQFLSEEGDAAERARLWERAAAEPNFNLWIVDPLDGTTNYARQLPSFCTSIALYRAGAVQCGVVYDPTRHELFAAERGRGAWRNGKPLAVSSRRKFADAVIGVEWARDQALRERTADIYSQMVIQATTARAFGSAALSLSYVAAGRLDAYFHFSLSPWDFAAAALIIEEAGGKITTPQGKAWNIHSQAFVATNGLLHRAALEFFK